MGCHCFKANPLNKDNSNVVVIYLENENVNIINESSNNNQVINKNDINNDNDPSNNNIILTNDGDNKKNNSNNISFHNYNDVDDNNYNLSNINNTLNKIITKDNYLSVLSNNLLSKEQHKNILQTSSNINSNLIKLTSNTPTKENILSKINTYKEKFVRILSFNNNINSNKLETPNYNILEYNKNKLNAYNCTKNSNNMINQSYVLENTDTRGKTFSKSFINSTSLNTIMFTQHFAFEMLKEINLVRKNPACYADKIKEFMKYINTDEVTNRKFFLVNKNTKINLNRGEPAFIDCLNFIKEFDKKIDEGKLSLNELKLKEDLKFPFPFEEPERSTNKDYIRENLLNIKKNLHSNLKLKGFHYDLSTFDAEISTILQIVDDNNSSCKRRNMLLDDTIKYVGINIGKLKDDLYCIYLVFAA